LVKLGLVYGFSNIVGFGMHLNARGLRIIL